MPTPSALLVLGQTLSRFIALEGADTADLRALGMTGRQLWAVAMARMALLGAAAAAVGTVAAAIASPLSPLGMARTIEPSPGVSIDGAALALGAAGIVVFVLALSAYPAWRTARSRAAADLASDRPSILAGGVARAGFPPAVVAGTRNGQVYLFRLHRRGAGWPEAVDGCPPGKGYPGFGPRTRQ